MSLKKSFLLALSNILYDKTRSLLTMLGIIIGVAAVIILISLMNGMTGMMMDQLRKSAPAPSPCQSRTAAAAVRWIPIPSMPSGMNTPIWSTGSPQP